MNGNASCSTSIVEFANLWHGMLDRVNFASMKSLKALRLIRVVNVYIFS